MKTLFFCNLVPLKIGAFEMLLVSIGKECKSKGDELVLVLAGEPIPEVALKLSEQGVRWHVIGGWGDIGCKVRPWRFCIPALHLLRKELPDVGVVSFGNELPSLIVALAAHLMMPKHIRWVWQQDQQIRDPGWIASRLSKIRLLAWGMDHFVVVYDGGKQSLIRRGIPPERISVFHNCIVDYQPVNPKGWLRREMETIDRRRQTTVDGRMSMVSPVLLVTNGSFIPRKRIDFILCACVSLGEEKNREQKGTKEKKYFSACCGKIKNPSCASWRPVITIPPWRLLVIGEGPERERLVALASELGIADRVHFLGLRNDVREILKECDIYLHASLAETCTYAITESMAAGMPAIVTEAGAASEQIVHGQTGYILQRDDNQGFVEALLRCMRDESLRVRMGMGARARWVEKFKLDNAGSRYRDLYATLCESKSV